MSGWSISFAPNAERNDAWWIACAAAQRIPAAAPSVQSSRVWPTISMIVGTPRPGSPTMPGPRAVVLDLARGVGVVAELVLEALQVHRVARAVGEHAREQEARQPLVGLGEHQEEVAHRRRAEPLVPGDLILAPVARRAEGARDGGVRAHVGAALFLGHRHPADRAALLARRARGGVVGRRRHERLPLGGELGAGAQGRHDGEGHRHRAGDAGLGLDRRHVQAPRARRARLGSSLVHGSECSSWPVHRRISSCQAGWNSTSSIRLP